MAATPRARRNGLTSKWVLVGVAWLLVVMLSATLVWYSFTATAP